MKTVKVIACEELCRVAGTDKEGRPVGFSYDECLKRVHERRVTERGDDEETARRTSKKSLRWYAKSIRSQETNYFEGWKLPRGGRPRG